MKALKRLTLIHSATINQYPKSSTVHLRRFPPGQLNACRVLAAGDCYTYNLFNQLRTVTMTRGTTTQTRTFNYNTLFQLTSVVEPETGTTTYTYWTDGQIRTKTDAKGNVTTYVRDGYGRLGAIYRKPSGATVDDPTQTTTYGYDTGVNAQGRLSSVAVGAATETYEYTVGGLVSKKSVAFPNNDTPLEAVYTYDTLGRMISLKYPDVYNSSGAVAEVGRTLGYQYFDPMGPQKLTDSTYASPGWRVTAQRNAAGQLTQMVVYQPNGTSETETFTYNGLGQLTQASGRGSNIEYRYSTTGNDGRITSRKDNISGEEVSYTYDQLGRLIAAATTGPEWGLSWVYDGFGNRLQQNVTKGTGPSAVFAVDPATNRLSTVGTGIVYDANGSMTAFGTGAGNASYDVDNRMVSESTSNGTEGYAYSVANQRLTVTRPNGTVETFFYGLGGELLGVCQRGTMANGHKYFSSTSIRVWFDGRLIDGPGGSMVTDRLGSVVKNGTESLSYYPYGEQRLGNANADREKFATYTRDAASGLDYAWNRYYSPQLGRFTAAAPFGDSASKDDPGTFDRYAYVSGDPVNWLDPTGLVRCGDIVGFDGPKRLGTLRDLVKADSSLGYIARVAWAEAAFDVGEIGAVVETIPDRWRVSQGLITLPFSPTLLGIPMNASVETIIGYRHSFHVVNGNGNASLTAGFQAKLDSVLDAEADDTRFGRLVSVNDLGTVNAECAKVWYSYASAYLQAPAVLGGVQRMDGPFARYGVVLSFQGSSAIPDPHLMSFLRASAGGTMYFFGIPWWQLAQYASPVVPGSSPRPNPGRERGR